MRESNFGSLSYVPLRKNDYFYVAWHFVKLDLACRRTMFKSMHTPKENLLHLIFTLREVLRYCWVTCDSLGYGGKKVIVVIADKTVI